MSLDDKNRRAGYGSKIDFHLNADGNVGSSVLDRNTGGPHYGDVRDYGSFIDPNNDVFFVNFKNGNLSDQSAAVKQGFAVGLAVRKVLQATGAKKVILFGHSMGGLAIREYLQTKLNWPDGPNGAHHVAKLITTGTPHRGSNASSENILIIAGNDETSEAVRDLRYPKSTTSDERDRGVYLFGGNEQNINRIGLFNYYNRDVDCNGYLGTVAGLNEKDLYLDLAYSCIIGVGGTSVVPTTTGYYGDDIVEYNRASVFNLGYRNLTGDTFYAYKKNEEQGAEVYYNFADAFTWHTRLSKQRFINTYALDEPRQPELAFEIDLGKSYRGFFTPQQDESRRDTDIFKLLVPQSGILTINCAVPQNTLIRLLDGNLNQIGSFMGGIVTTRLAAGGTYYIEPTGNAGEGSFWQFTSYTLGTSFCPLPNPPTVVANAATTFCEGGQVTLSTPANLDTYRWYVDGVNVGGNSNSITVNKAGTYMVETTACGVTVSSANQVSVRINPIPATPVITIQNQPFGLLATNATNYQWYRNGQKIDNATQSLFSGVSSGAYTVRTTVSGCSSESLPFVITGVKENTAELVKVRPNPSEGYFQVELPAKTAVSIELTDLMGRRVYTQFDKVKSSLKIVDAQPIATGVYILKVKYNEQELSRKIIIK